METEAFENIATMVANFASGDPRYQRIVNFNLAVNSATIAPAVPIAPAAPRLIVPPTAPETPAQSPQKKKSNKGRDIGIGVGVGVGGGLFLIAILIGLIIYLTKRKKEAQLAADEAEWTGPVVGYPNGPHVANKQWTVPPNTPHAYNYGV